MGNGSKSVFLILHGESIPFFWRSWHPYSGEYAIFKRKRKTFLIHRFSLTNERKTNMKKAIIIATMGMILGFVACSSEEAKHADVALSTVQCGMCEKTIESGMAKIDGIAKFDVDLNEKVGHVTYKASVINLEAIEKAVSALGYQANNTKADPTAYEALAPCCKIGGMH